MSNKKLINRNKKCPCGSNIRYKNCHGKLNTQSDDLSHKRALAHQENIKIQQGQGIPIQYILNNGYRHIKVGNYVYSGPWKTFHGFLTSYLRSCLGEGWLPLEEVELSENSHPILIWHQQVLRTWRHNMKNYEPIFCAPHTGASRCYLDLAYNLYQLAHNSELQDKLIKRLKNNNDQFPGAFYESFIYNYLIRAGFDIEIDDGKHGFTGKNHDCIATYKKNGNKYAVEIKAINRKGVLGVYKNATDDILKENNVRSNLNKALQKKSTYQKLIFIELSLPPNEDLQQASWEDEIIKIVKEEQELSRVEESAYLIFTNHSAHRTPNNQYQGKNILFLGFRIPDFGIDLVFNDLEEYYYAKKRHLDIYELLLSMAIHYEIPATFDGSIPEFSFGKDVQPRLLIGNSYEIPDQDGNSYVGILQTATIIETEKICHGVYWVDTLQKHIHATCPISDSELIAYKRNPDTFFGVIRKVVKDLGSKDPISIFEFYWDTYKDTPKEKLIELLQFHPKINEIKSQTQEYLAVIYCKAITLSSLKAEKEKIATDV